MRAPCSGGGILAAAGVAVVGLLPISPVYADPVARAGEEQGPSALEEIVVTAQKRSERLIDVPISLSAFSSEAIEQTGSRQLKNIAGFIPNLHITSDTDFNSRVTIRGVGANSRNIGFDTRVGVYLDGVYLGQSPALNQDLLDLERVEVLRGPQGTLFGMNTVAGAINLISRKPGRQREGSFSSSFGNFGARQLSSVLSSPISDSLAAKISVSKIDRDGTVRNLHNNRKLNELDSLAYRAQAVFDPNDRVEVNFSIDGLHGDRLALTGDALSDTFGSAPDTTAPEPREVNFNVNTAEERDLFGGSMNMEYRFGGDFSVKTISAYRNTEVFYTNDTDYSPADILFVEYSDEYEQFSQEIQLISPSGGDFDYLFGAYYFRQIGDTRRDAVNGEAAEALGNTPGTVVRNDGRVTTDSYAAYFNGTYRITERINVGLGARYSHDRKAADWDIDGTESGVFNILTAEFRGSRSDNHISPSLSINYALSGDVNAYARYAAGHKSGGYNLDFVNADFLTTVDEDGNAEPVDPDDVQDVLNENLSFDKETVDSYEIGLKGNAFNRMLSFGLAGFLSRFSDYQVNQFVDLGGGRTSATIRNAAKVETKGLEAELSLHPVSGLTLQGALGLLDASFRSFPGGGTAGADVGGNDLSFASRMNAALSAQYYHDVPALDATLLLRADLTHQDGFYTTADNVKEITLADDTTIPFGYVKPQTSLGARIGLTSIGKGWEIHVWGRNLTDERRPVESVRDFLGTVVVVPNEPRTYGVDLGWRF